jgi:hypothetical protein
VVLWSWNKTDWYEGLVTEYLVATFADYFGDVKLYVEERSFKRFAEACLEDTIVIYMDHLLIQVWISLLYGDIQTFFWLPLLVLVVSWH